VNLKAKLRLDIFIKIHLLSDFHATSVPGPNPDPPDPRVFWPPGSGCTSQRYGSGSGSGSGSSSCKNNKKNLKPYYFVTLFDFLSLKNNVNVPSKSNTQTSRKNCVKKLALCWHLEGQ
jgi:hypothetical protein